MEENGCMGTEGFTLVVTWLTGSYGLLPLPSITVKYCTVHCQPGKISKFKIQCTDSTECISLLHNYEGEKS